MLKSLYPNVFLYKTNCLLSLLLNIQLHNILDSVCHLTFFTHMRLIIIRVSVYRSGDNKLSHTFSNGNFSWNIFRENQLVMTSYNFGEKKIIITKKASKRGQKLYAYITEAQTNNKFWFLFILDLINFDLPRDEKQNEFDFPML